MTIVTKHKKIKVKNLIGKLHPIAAELLQDEVMGAPQFEGIDDGAFLTCLELSAKIYAVDQPELLLLAPCPALNTLRQVSPNSSVTVTLIGPIDKDELIELIIALNVSLLAFNYPDFKEFGKRIYRRYCHAKGLTSNLPPQFHLEKLAQLAKGAIRGEKK